MPQIVHVTNVPEMMSLDLAALLSVAGLTSKLDCIRITMSTCQLLQVSIISWRCRCLYLFRTLQVSKKRFQNILIVASDATDVRCKTCMNTLKQDIIKKKMEIPRTLGTPSKRLEAARQKMTPTRSTGALRNELRNRFLARLRHSRCRSYDKIRKLVDNADLLTENIIKELQNILLAAGESDLLDFDEVLDFFDNIQCEIIEKELETQIQQYEQFAGTELDDIIDRHLNGNCGVCVKPIIEEGLCENCLTLMDQTNGDQF